MKIIDELIETLTEKQEMHMELSLKKLNEGDQESSSYNEGIAIGIVKAIDDIKYANEQLIKRLHELI